MQELEKHTGGADKGGTVKNFLATMAENNRLGLLEGVCEKFGILMSASRGEMELTVTSAAVSSAMGKSGTGWMLTMEQKLDEKTLKRIETAIGKSPYSGGKKLKLITKVNPEILGGLIVEVGERTIDYSVASKVARMNKMLTEAI